MGKKKYTLYMYGNESFWGSRALHACFKISSDPKRGHTFGQLLICFKGHETIMGSMINEMIHFLWAKGVCPKLDILSMSCKNEVNIFSIKVLCVQDQGATQEASQRWTDFASGTRREATSVERASKGREIFQKYHWTKLPAKLMRNLSKFVPKHQNKCPFAKVMGNKAKKWHQICPKISNYV